MTTSSKSESLGPLPKSDRASQVEELSFQALDRVLPIERFVLRREPKDKGVDKSLEVLFESRHTNFRAQVQMKGTDESRLNMDGSFSLEIEVSNFNYLLNGNSPLYFLYIVPLNEIRFIWAHDERQRIEAKNPGWVKQKNINIRFYHSLSSDTIEEIYDRILKEGRLLRTVNESIIRYSSMHSFTISIDPKSLAATTPDDAYDIILGQGIAIVSNGYADLALSLVDILTAQQKGMPEVHQVCAYAKYLKGRYDAALAHIQEISISEESLPSDRREITESLRSMCEFQTGRISMSEYIERRETACKLASGVMKLEHRSEEIRYSILAERDPERRKELTEEYSRLINALSTSQGVSKAAVALGEITLLYLRGQELVHNYINLLGTALLRKNLGVYTATEEIVRDVSSVDAPLEEWEEKMQSLVELSIEDANPILLGDALFVRVVIRLAFQQQFVLFEKVHGKLFEKQPEDNWRYIREDLDQALGIFERFNILDGKVRTLIALADYHRIKGNIKKAREFGEKALPIAQAMEYVSLQEQALQHVENRTALDDSVKKMNVESEKDEDVFRAEMTEEEIKYAAKYLANTYELQDERIEVLERDFESYKGIAVERLDWCKHIGMLQNLSHTESPETHYREDPLRVCICKIKGVQSVEPMKNWSVLIEEFRGNYCIDCELRDPKK